MDEEKGTVVCMYGKCSSVAARSFTLRDFMICSGCNVTRYIVQALFEQVVSVNTRDISYNIGRVTIFTSVACRPIKFLNSSWSSYTVVFACGCRRVASHNWIYIVLIHAIYAIYTPSVESCCASIVKFA